MDEQKTPEHNQKDGVGESTPDASNYTHATHTESKTASGMSGKTLAVLGGLLILAILAVGAYLYFGDGNTQGLTGNDDVASGVDPVATVNGEEITRAQFSQQVTQARSSAQQQGADTEDAQMDQQIQEQALSTLINTELLVQAAADAGISPSESEISTEYSALVEQAGGESALQTRLDELGMTMEGLRADIAQELSIQSFISTQISTSSLAVSEAEIQEFYDQVSANQEELPPMEQVRGQIEQQLALNKQQEAVSTLIDELRANADIEVFILSDSQNG